MCCVLNLEFSQALKNHINLLPSLQIHPTLSEMTTNPQNLAFKFTAEEITVHSAVLGTPPVLQLYKRVFGDAKLDGKEFYSDLLLEKIAKVVSSKTAFRVSSTWKSIPKKGLTVCYVYCLHDISAIVLYKNEDFIQDRELSFNVEIKCAACLDVVVPLSTSASSVATTASSSSAPQLALVTAPEVSTTLQPQFEVSFLPRGPIADTAKEFCASVSDVVSRVFMSCSASEDPMGMLGSKKLN